MIDVKTHARTHPSNEDKTYTMLTSCSPHDTIEYDAFPRHVSASDPMDDQLAMLLPQVVPGFEMEAKRWG